MISFRFDSFLSLHILFRFVSQITDFVSFRFAVLHFCFVSQFTGTPIRGLLFQ